MLRLRFKFKYFFLSRDDDLIDPFSLNSWRTHLGFGPFWQGSRLVGRDTDAVSDSKDREPLSPDYKDPITKSSENRPIAQKPSFDQAVLPGGVIDVDVGGSDFPSSFPDISDDFGLSSHSGFGGENGGGLFGLGGFFGEALPEYKPWWKG